MSAVTESMYADLLSAFASGNGFSARSTLRRCRADTSVNVLCWFSNAFSYVL